MVNLLRVDERLLHGQIAVSWISNVGASSILIANNEVVNDEMMKVAIKLAKPSGINLEIRDLEAAAVLLKDHRSQAIPIFIIVKTIPDALKLVELTGNIIKHINIGGLKKKDNTKTVANGICVTEEDMECLRKLDTLVDELEFRLVATDPKIHYKNI